MDPAPDGRGEPPPPRPDARRFYLWLVLGLVVMLLFNAWVATQLEQPEPRLRVPYSPLFLDQVHAGNVASVSAKGDTVQGEFR